MDIHIVETTVYWNWGWNEIERHSANEVRYVEKPELLEKTKEKLENKEIGNKECQREWRQREKSMCSEVKYLQY